MELLTTQEALKLLKIDRKTLYKLLQNGDLPAIKLGSQWRIPLEEIEKLVGKAQGKNNIERRSNNVSK